MTHPKSGSGISNKAQVIKAVTSGCEVRSYKLSEIECTILSKESILLNYTVEQNGMCGEDTLKPYRRAAANYINQNGRWVEAFYMETIKE